MSETNTDSPRPKADIARENGAKSRGPVTPEGKARAAVNSLRHGLTAKIICLSNETPDRLNLLYQAYREAWQPANAVEDDLVQEVAVGKWIESRSWTIETALFDHQMDTTEKELEKRYEKLDEPTRLALAFKGLADDSHSLQLLLRYRGSANRQYHRALNQLITLRAKEILNNAPPTRQNKNNETNPIRHLNLRRPLT